MQDQLYKRFMTDGYVHLKNFFDEEEKANLVKWVNDLQELPEAPGKWLKYFESVGSQKIRTLCRVENFTPYHQGFEDLFLGEKISETLEILLQDKPVLFKEKINFKLPGGGAFAPHQDAPAFLSFDQKYHMTLMISIDQATLENGCLQVASAVEEGHTLKQSPDGTIHPDVYQKFIWKPILAGLGDVVFFGSYLPHYSEVNASKAPRRAIFVTYNRQKDGCRRDDYYREKRKYFPPDCERIPGVIYPKALMFNLGNPIND